MSTVVQQDWNARYDASSSQLVRPQRHERGVLYASKREAIFVDFFNLDERALGIIEDRYGLTGLDCFLPILLDGDECTLLEVRSATSKKAIVETESGLYFFKQIPWYCDTVEQITASTTIQRQLREAGSPLPGIVPTKNASLWTKIGDAKFVLFEFASGRRYSGTKEQKLGSARTLATMHLQEVTASTAPKEDIFELARDHIVLLGDTATKRAHDARTVLSDFINILSRAETHARSLGWSTLPLVAIHGDYNPWNLLFREDGEVAAILDFDNCDVAQRLHDVAEAILTHCILRYRKDSTNFASIQVDGLDIRAISDFLNTYEGVAPLTSTERKCLPYVVQAIYIELTCLGMIRQDIDLNEGHRATTWLLELPNLWNRISAK
ncbi:MAG: phosphotransferase [Pseudonocardiaceae bacterium]